MLTEPKDRELYVEGYPDELYVVPSYSVPEAAMALGRTQLTLKRWIKDKLVPEPQLIGGNYNYRHYSEGELQSIAKVLVEHEQEYDYLHHTHTMTVNRIWQEVEAYRKEYV